MDGLDYAKCQKSRKGIHWELVELLMRKRQKAKCCLPHFESQNSRRCGEWLV